MVKTNIYIYLTTIIMSSVIPCFSFASSFTVSKVEVPAKVGRSNIGLFNSPIFTFNDDVYVAYVSDNDDGTHSTFVAKYEDNNWIKAIVEPLTMNNQYHAQASIALDVHGYIHVTYNMHSSPWQYSVSKKPEDLSAWVFKGQSLNGPHNVKKSAVVTGKGTASIPGNRISYHYMATDIYGNLFISYREALKLSQRIKYGDRQWSLGISKYDVNTMTWNRVGAKDTTLPFVSEPGYRPQVGHMSFDKLNRLHVSWNWYVEYSLNGSKKPNVISYAYSDDGGKSFLDAYGEPLSLPISRAGSDKIIDEDFYLSYTKVAGTSTGLPIVSIMPKPPSKKNRSLIIFHNETGWSKNISLPYGATDFYIDNDDSIIAISSGLRIHKSSDYGKTWETSELDVVQGPYIYWIDRAYTLKTGNLRFLAQGKKNNKLIVYTIDFNGS